MLPAPIIPRPPALLTALANRQPLAHIIPAWMMGYWMLKREVILLLKGPIDKWLNGYNVELLVCQIDSKLINQIHNLVNDEICMSL